jgi:hypothetical protein
MYQMVVVLLFNHETQIKTDLLIQILNHLVKSNLISCAELNDEDLKENDFYLNSIIQLADDFKRYTND